MGVRRHFLIPGWLTRALVFLGFVFVVFPPVVAVDWFQYVAALLIAVGVGVYWRRSYRATVVERTRDSVLVRYSRRTRAKSS
jgi:hypothetical protein